MKKSKNIETQIYSKPEKLLSFVDNINLIKTDIKSLDAKIIQLQRNEDGAKSVSTNIEESPQFQKYAQKKIKAKEKRRRESEFILKTVDSIITTFRDIEISDYKDIQDVRKCFDVALENAVSESDKGAILSNILSLHVNDSVKNEFYNEVENFILKDKELLTGYLMHTLNDEERTLTYNIFDTSKAMEELFKNSIVKRLKDKQSSVVSNTILEDNAYLDKFFTKLGTRSASLEKIKGLSKEDKKQIKKQYFKYKVETNTKPKLGSGMLTYSAKLPGAVSKVLKGTFSAVGSVFQMINWTFISLGVIVAIPFDLIKMGLDGVNTLINKNRTYKDDMTEIYKDVTKALKRSGLKFKNISDIKVNVDEDKFLSIGCVVNKKRHMQEVYEVKYSLSDGEYKNFRNIMKEYFDDKENGAFKDFEVGEMRKKKDIIRFMRRIAEVTKEEKNISTVNFVSSFDEAIQEIKIDIPKSSNPIPTPDYQYADEIIEEDDEFKA